MTFHFHPKSCIASISVWMFFAFVSCQLLPGQSYSRTQSTGHWRDGEWEDPSETTVTQPTFGTDVFVGTSISTNSVVPAEVDVFTTPFAIGSLTIGPDSGSLTGTVNILTGAAPGDATTSGHLTVNGAVLVRQGLLSVTGGGAVTADTMTVDSTLANATLDGMANVGSLGILNGGGVNVGSSGNLVSTGDVTISDGSLLMSSSGVISASKLILDAASSSATLAGAISIGEVELSNGSVLNIGSDMSPTSVTVNASTLNINSNVIGLSSFEVMNGEINLNSGTMGALNSTVFNNATVNKNGGIMDLFNLTMTGGTNLSVETGDDVKGDLNLLGGSQLDSTVELNLASVNLAGTSTMSFVQSLGGNSGVTMDDLLIETGSSLDLVFDGLDLSMLDWGLRLVGDQQTTLQSMVDNNLITTTGTAQPITVFYDSARFGDFTYLGVVPEPGSAVFLGFIGLVALTRRHRAVRS